MWTGRVRSWELSKEKVDVDPWCTAVAPSPKLGKRLRRGGRRAVYLFVGGA